MSGTIEEQLSAMLDGELPAEQEDLLFRRLERDPELRAKFGRYSMIADSMSEADIYPDALRIADQVRTQLAADEAPAQQPASFPAISSGLVGAGLAAAAALVVALNLNPTNDTNQSPRLAGVAPAAVRQVVQPKANINQERMTRYLVTHSEFANSASRQFVDSHLVMPAFQRATWQTTGSNK